MIEGHWTEDNTRYLIQAPNQLCEQIVLMQNLLVDKLNEIQHLEKELNAARDEANGLLLF
jgi:isochorismate synthase EntC